MGICPRQSRRTARRFDNLPCTLNIVAKANVAQRKFCTAVDLDYTRTKTVTEIQPQATCVNQSAARVTVSKSIHHHGTRTVFYQHSDTVDLVVQCHICRAAIIDRQRCIRAT